MTVYSCGVAIPISGVLKVKNEIIEGIISHYGVVSDGLLYLCSFTLIQMLIKAELHEIATGMEVRCTVSPSKEPSQNEIHLHSISIPSLC